MLNFLLFFIIFLNTNAEEIRAKYLLKFLNLNEQEYYTELSKDINEIINEYDSLKAKNQYTTYNNLIDNEYHLSLFKKISLSEKNHSSDLNELNLDLIFYKNTNNWKILLNNKKITKLDFLNEEKTVKLISVQRNYIVIAILKTNEKQLNQLKNISIYKNQCKLSNNNIILCKIRPRQILNIQSLLFRE